MCVCVCVSVCLCVTRDLRNRSMDHYETLGDVRGQKSKNHHMAAFLKKFLFFQKPLICCKNAFLEVIGTLGKKGSNNLCKILTKCVNKWCKHFDKSFEKSTERFSYKMHEDMAFFCEKSSFSHNFWTKWTLKNFDHSIWKVWIQENQLHTILFIRLDQTKMRLKYF